MKNLDRARKWISDDSEEKNSFSVPDSVSVSVPVTVAGKINRRRWLRLRKKVGGRKKWISNPEFCFVMTKCHAVVLVEVVALVAVLVLVVVVVVLVNVAVVVVVVLIVLLVAVVVLV